VEQALGGEVVKIDLNQPMKDILERFKTPDQTRLSLTGTMIVARDSAHAKLRERWRRRTVAGYFKNHPVYYAGPAKTPDGYASGAFGPTTAGGWIRSSTIQAAGGSMVMWQGQPRGRGTRACKKHGGFYLGSIGGAAAISPSTASEVEVWNIRTRMEAIWRIEVGISRLSSSSTTRAMTSSRN